MKFRTVITQVGLFGGIGGTALILDALTFYFCRSLLELDIPSANLAGRVVGAVLAFAGNRAWTFRRPARERLGIVLEGRKYVQLAVVNYLASTGALITIASLTTGLSAGVETGAKLVVDILIVTVSFLLQRQWVFRRKRSMR